MAHRRYVWTRRGTGRNPADDRQEEKLRRMVLAHHEEIFQAIAAGDSVAAKKAMEIHVQDLIDRNLRAMVRDRSNLVTRELSEEEAVYDV